MDQPQLVRVVVNCHSIVEEPNLRSPVQCPFCLATVQSSVPVTLVTPVKCGVCSEDFHIVYLDATVVASVATAIDAVVPRLVLVPPGRDSPDVPDFLHEDQSAIIP